MVTFCYGIRNLPKAAALTRRTPRNPRLIACAPCFLALLGAAFKKNGSRPTAALAVHDRATPDERFIAVCGLIEAAAADAYNNFVRKAVQWTRRSAFGHPAHAPAWVQAPRTARDKARNGSARDRRVKSSPQPDMEQDTHMARTNEWADKILGLLKGGNTTAAVAQIKVAPSVKDLKALHTAMLVGRLSGRWRDVDAAVEDNLALLSAPRLHRAP